MIAFQERLRGVLPKSWFPRGADPVLDSVLAGHATLLENSAQQLAFVAMQTRIKTSTGEWLDLVSNDFFGPNLPRLAEEPDDAFRARILANLFAIGPTRALLSTAVQRTTGSVPQIVEPQLPSDCGGWDTAGGWGIAGHWGACPGEMDAQFFVVPFIGQQGGIPNVGGYDVGALGWDIWGEWIELAMAQARVAITDVDAAIESCHPVGTVAWTAAQTAPVSPNIPPYLGINITLGSTPLWSESYVSTNSAYPAISKWGVQPVVQTVVKSLYQQSPVFVYPAGWDSSSPIAGGWDEMGEWADGSVLPGQVVATYN